MWEGEGTFIKIECCQLYQNDELIKFLLNNLLLKYQQGNFSLFSKELDPLFINLSNKWILLI